MVNGSVPFDNFARYGQHARGWTAVSGGMIDFVGTIPPGHILLFSSSNVAVRLDCFVIFLAAALFSHIPGITSTS